MTIYCRGASVNPVEAYRTAAERQVTDLKAKSGTDGAESLATVRATYERARSQQQQWVAAVIAAASTSQHQELQAATTSGAAARFECIQARRAAFGQPAFAPALADGVRRGIVKDYTAEAERRFRELKAGGTSRAAEASGRLNEALPWKEWDTIT